MTLIHLPKNRGDAHGYRFSQGPSRPLSRQRSHRTSYASEPADRSSVMVARLHLAGTETNRRASGNPTYRVLLFFLVKT